MTTLLLALEVHAYTITPSRSIACASSSTTQRSASCVVYMKKGKVGGGGGGGKLVQVVLSEPIKGIGKKGDLVSVKSSYAENVIVRGGKGKIATDETLEQIAKETAQAAADAAAAKAQAIKDEATLEKVFGEKGCEIAKQAGPDGNIFGKVTPTELAEAIKARTGVTVEKKNIAVSFLPKITGAAAARLTVLKCAVLTVRMRCMCCADAID